jgi:hypothetical protein
MLRRTLKVITLALFVVAVPSIALAAAGAILPDCPGCPYCP